MKKTTTIDTARVELLLSELRLPGIKLMWSKFAEQADSFCLSLTINVRFKRAGQRPASLSERLSLTINVRSGRPCRA
jgi:hypothetical protein